MDETVRVKSALLLMMVSLLLEGGVPVPKGRLPIETFARHDRVPEGGVEVIQTDLEGRVWVGTQDGLWAFDGTLWSRLPLPDLPDGRAWIFSSLCEPGGDLWFGTNGQGLLHRAAGTWQRLGPEGGLPPRNISALAWSPEGGGRLWIGSQDRGLWLREDGRFRPIPAPPDGPLPPVNTLNLQPGPSGPRLYVGTYRGLYVWEAERWTFIGPQGTPRPRVLSVALQEGPKGTVAWVGTRAGLYRWDGAWTGPVPGLPSNYVYTLTMGPSPAGGTTLWAGTPRGLAWQDGAGWTTLRARDGLPADYIRCLAVTGVPGHPCQQVWVGTQSGLARLATGLWQGVDSTLGLAEDPVNAIHEDPEGSLWFGHVSQGISRWKGGQWERHDIADAPDQPAVHTFATLHRPGLPAQVFAGTRGRGVLQWNGRAWVAAPWNARLPDPDVYALREDPQLPGALWIGTDNGLAVLRGNRLEQAALGAPDSRIECLAPRRDAGGVEEVWVGTRNLGLWRLRAGAWSRMGLDAGFSSNHVSALCLGQDGRGAPRLWVGTLGSGIFELDPDHPGRPWTHRSSQTRPPIPNDFITGIQQDPHGRTFLFTYQGIVLLDPNHGLRFFTRSDGLPTDTCNRGAHLLDHEGWVWAGTPRGAAFLDARWMVPPSPLPPPRFAEAQAVPSGRLLAPGVRLSHRERGIRVRMSMTAYHREPDHLFRFQIEGLEPRPTAWSRSAVRELASLPPGDYVLLAWVQSPDGLVSPAARLAFSVGYAPWAHPLALAAYSALALGLAFLFFRLRIRMLNHRSRLLQAQVAAATGELRDRNQDLAHLNAQQKQLLHLLAHDLRNPLSTVTLMAEEIREGGEADETRESARRIQQVSASMTALLGRILELEALETGSVAFEAVRVDLDALLEQVSTEFTPLAARKQQVLARVPTALTLLADPRFTLEVARNLVSNAVKYSPIGGRIQVRPLAEGDLAGFEVVDEGPGIPLEERERLFAKFAKLSPRPTQGESSAGVGLANARLVVEGMGGRIRYAPGPEARGSAFQVLLPLAPA